VIKEDKVFSAQVMKEKGRSGGVALLSHKLTYKLHEVQLKCHAEYQYLLLIDRQTGVII